VNTYSIFAELKRCLLNPNGRVGCIVPSGIATDDTTKFFFQDLMDKGSLVSLYSFENEEFVFPKIHHATKFCLLTMSGGSDCVKQADLLFFARQTPHLGEEDRHFTLSAEEIAILNPNTRTCPIFRSKRDAELTKYIYSRIPVVMNNRTKVNPWDTSYRQGLFHSSTDAAMFNDNTLDQLTLCGATAKGNTLVLGNKVYLPFYEAKMVHQFDHRYATFEGATQANLNSGILPQASDNQKTDPGFTVRPRYWVLQEEVQNRVRELCHKDWLLGFRDVTSAVVERTVICVMLPVVGISDQFGLFFTGSAGSRMTACLLANLNSFVSDYVARQKIGGGHLKKYLLLQLPCLPPLAYGDSDVRFIASRAVELTYTAWDLGKFAADCGYNGPPFIWNDERRFKIRTELDAAFFHLYLSTKEEWEEKASKELLEYFPTPREAVDYIMETFRIVRERDEEKHGSYRTKDTILEIYDKIAEAIKTGQPYETILDPLPGPPVDENGNFTPMSQWDVNNWPSNIHQPRGVEK
jgi:hypothetical protein